VLNSLERRIATVSFIDIPSMSVELADEELSRVVGGEFPFFAPFAYPFFGFPFFGGFPFYW
jgi:hypothetical protein